MSTPAVQEVVVIWLSGKPFAFPVDVVREVVQIVQPTPIPSWPEAMLGIIDIRGELLPLFDMSEIVDQPPVTISKDQFVVVFFAHGRNWGLLVDGVDGVKTFELRLSRPQGGTSTSISRGLVSDKTMTAVLLDPSAIVAALGLDSDLINVAVQP